MSLIQWDDSLSTGIDSIDLQHKELLRYFNAMNDKLAAGRDRNALVDALDSSRNYIKYHFAHEERLMDHYGYADAMEHKALHQEFVNKVDSIEGDETRTIQEKIVDLQSFLINWIVAHITTVDKKLGVFLLEQED